MASKGRFQKVPLEELLQDDDQHELHEHLSPKTLISDAAVKQVAQAGKLDLDEKNLGRLQRRLEKLAFQTKLWRLGEEELVPSVEAKRAAQIAKKLKEILALVDEDFGSALARARSHGMLEEALRLEAVADDASALRRLLYGHRATQFAVLVGDVLDKVAPMPASGIERAARGLEAVLDLALAAELLAARLGSKVGQSSGRELRHSADEIRRETVWALASLYEKFSGRRCAVSADGIGPRFILAAYRLIEAREPTPSTLARDLRARRDGRLKADSGSNNDSSS